MFQITVAATMSLASILLLYFFLQKWMAKSLVGSGLKV